MVSAMASAEVPKFTVVLRKAYAAGFYAMCAPGFEPRATLALPTASIGPMAPEASTNAVYANKIAEIADPVQRQQFIDDRVAEQSADFNLVELASRLIIDAIVAPQDLRADLLARLDAADGWDRAIDRRHHPVWPV
jgi:acetyl-CoA carboxylase carboxyltransferase component